MSPAKTARIMAWVSVALIVTGIPGAIFASDSLSRNAQFLAIGMGVLGLLTVRVFLPWAQRRGHQRIDE